MLPMRIWLTVQKKIKPNKICSLDTDFVPLLIRNITQNPIRQPMKKRTIFAATLVALTMGTQAQVIESYQVRDAVTLRGPIETDSINGEGRKYETKNLLSTAIGLNQEYYATQPMQADTAGVITLAKADGEHLIYVATTQIRTDRFVKAKLKVSSPARWEVYVDGVSKMKKENADDSLDMKTTRDIALRMEPERNYEITIKLLAHKDDKAVPAFKCEVVKDKGYEEANVLSGHNLKKRFTLDNTVYGNRVIDVAISPSGKYLLTRYWNNYSKGRQHVYAQLSEVKTGKVLIANAKDGMRWMPKSDKLYYTATAATGNNVIVLNPATLTEEVLLTEIPADGFTWAPTEDYLIYYPHEKGQAEQGPLKRVATPRDRIPGYRGRSFLAKYDIKKGTTERLTYGKRSTSLNDISRDGKKILFSTYAENITVRPFGSTSFYQLDLTTYAIDTLVYETGFVNSAKFSPDGTQVLFIGSAESFDGIGKNCGQHPIANDYDKQAYIMDLATRKVTPITMDFAPSVNFLQWNAADKHIYFTTDDKDEVNVYRYNTTKKAFEMLPLEVSVIQRFSIPSQNAGMAAYYGQDDHTAGVGYLFDMKKMTSRLIADPMKPILDEIELGETHEWNFTASDGTIIHGKYCLPPAFDPTKKYPLIVYYYGGTTPTVKGISNPYCAQLFASRDYVVYVVQPSGTLGYGQEFAARHVNAWGKRTADDIIEGTKQFCAEHPYVDAERIGCLGASYGGFMTQYLQTQTDIFAAAVSHAGISNVTSYWGEGYWGYSYNAIAAADSYPWQNPDLFTKQGSLFNADKINTPLLLLHGTVDTNVPIGESIQLFNALKILGKTVEFIQVEGEDHFVADYDKRVLWHNTIMAWFARYLQGNDKWWNDLYPERHL